MNRLTKLFAQTATAAATSLLVAACGGGDATPPPGSSNINAGTTAPAPDTKAPTVTIFDDTPAATATGPVTFTFVFSEDVGASFTASDVVVTGGTAGVFTKVSATQATLVVTPTANTAGTINVSVPAGTFSDLAGNANTAGATAQQTYNMTAPTSAPTTEIPAGSTVIYSDAASVTGLDTKPDWGQNPAVVFSEPTIAGNKSLKYTFSGTALYEGIDWSGNPQNVSTKTTLHLDFFSADITSVKVSIISAGKENAVTKAVTAGSWNAIDIDLAQYTVPDKTAIIQIKLEPSTVGTLYVDNIYFYGAAAGAACGTTAPTCAPTTAIPAGSVTIYSDASTTAGFIPRPDWGQPTAYSEVTIAGNKSLKYTGLTYEGIEFAAVNVAGKSKVHFDFWSPDLSAVKVSLISPGPKESAVTKTLTAGGWNSIDIDLSSYTVQDLTAIFQIKLESTGAPGTLYVDNIHFYGTAAGGGGAGPFTGGIFADDYVGNLPSTSKSVQGGDVGFFYDARLFNTKVYDYGGVSGTAQDPAGVHNFYYGLGLSKPALTDAYFGAYVKAPGNATVDVSAFANIKLNVWGPDQQFGQLKGAAGTYPTLKAVLQGPAVAGCSTSSGGSEISATFNTTQQGAASIYTLPLSSFTLVGGCGGDTTVAQVLKHIAQVNVLMTGTAIQYATPDTGTPAGYPNGLNIGSIKFN